MQLHKEVWNKHSIFIKYLIVGGWNTLCGYLVFSILYYYLHEKIHYTIIIILSNIFSITNAFIFYKYFVFKTKGNLLKEYFKCYLVYGAGMIVNLLVYPLFQNIVIPKLYNIIGLVGLDGTIPYVAQFSILFLTITLSFKGHKKFSFRTA